MYIECRSGGGRDRSMRQAGRDCRLQRELSIFERYDVAPSNEDRQLLFSLVLKLSQL